MVAIKFKQKCSKCNTNYVVTAKKVPYIVCYDCQKEDLEKEIDDPFVKNLFNIPIDYYRENAFLRNVKINYIKYKTISEKQISAFKKIVEEIEKDRKQ